MSEMRALRADRPVVESTTKAPRKAQPARREMPKRQRRRRGLALAGVVLTLVAAAGTARGIQLGWDDRIAVALDQGLDDSMRAAGLGVAEITLQGRNNAGLDAVRRALGVSRGDPILRLDLAELQSRVQAVGWVRTATITRQLPDRLHVVIEEREPFVRWQMDGQTALIDREGVVILPEVGNRFQNLPRIVGAGANERALELVELLSIAPAIAAEVATATLVRERRWDIGLKSGITVRLPEEDAAGAWARLAEPAAQARLLGADVAQIDLRVPGRVIVRARGDTSQDSGSGRDT